MDLNIPMHYGSDKFLYTTHSYRDTAPSGIVSPVFAIKLTGFAVAVLYLLQSTDVKYITARGLTKLDHRVYAALDSDECSFE